MGVYIPKMEMPPTCGACAFFIPNIHDRGDDSICPLAICETRADCKKPSYCPLVEVKPHGQLIDADALLDNLYVEYPSIVFGIEDAPTIIEAETCNETCNKAQDICNKAEDDAVNANKESEVGE